MFLSVEKMKLLTTDQLFDLIEETIKPQQFTVMPFLAYGDTGFWDFDLIHQPAGHVPSHYGFTTSWAKFCATDSDRFYGKSEGVFISVGDEWDETSEKQYVPEPVVQAWQRLATMMDCDLICDIRQDDAEMNELVLIDIDLAAWPLPLVMALSIFSFVFGVEYPLITDFPPRLPLYPR